MAEDIVKMKIRYIMSSPVITVKASENVVKVARIMDLHDIGSVVVVDEAEKPLGIITDMDIVKRVVARNLNPSNIKVENVMSQPLITVSPDIDITDAAKLMSRYGVKRLAVVYKGRLVGIISSRDITAVTPELMEIIHERARIEEGTVIPRYAQRAVGYCEICGQWSDVLTLRNGKFLCKDCIEGC